jgi:hypothetical protein
VRSLVAFSERVSRSGNALLRDTEPRFVARLKIASKVIALAQRRNYDKVPFCLKLLPHPFIA